MKISLEYGWDYWVYHINCNMIYIYILGIHGGNKYHIVVCVYIYIHIYIGNTSSTAQGGGGSLKHRKPIVEVGCCESRMAERIH